MTEIELSVSVKGNDDPEALDLIVQNLREDLRDCEDITRVRPAPGRAPAPAGTRSPSVADIGILLAELTVTAHAMRSLILVVQNWVTRNNSFVEVRIGKEKLKISAASPQTQAEVTEAFLKRIADN